jgi:alkanesulfonate monooxygenase SsuD/methylene tetrahydromethanopterin reductase-like flavin-dependent oxidoreductase (luciferase family)
LTLGVGLGSDRFGHEFSRTGDQTDDRVRARMLDEGLAVLAAAWSGAPVHHRGDHYTVDDLRFLPRPAQQGGIPVWAAGFPGRRAPMRRAARLDGYFPVNLEHPDQLAEAVVAITELRAATGATDGPYDVAVALPAGTDPGPYQRAGATWWLAEFPCEAISVDAVRGVLRDGPADAHR